MKKALKIKKNILGERNVSYGVSLLNLSNTFNNLGDKKAALEGYQKVIEIFKEKLG
jgi:tetratricopeptide (TPR) repeat protein